ncbi:hypothetical protein AVEN_272662-1 [Araneus ventricosus]|uniref:Uncharacterized protein n=1 Tax=Araneus ventricosus TaxID=182803 RepID=A0A4Y2NP46_ARAVE|nr:hypothetical protein AVEN_272662-1 [Araneus ventricosus]
MPAVENGQLSRSNTSFCVLCSNRRRERNSPLPQKKTFILKPTIVRQAPRMVGMFTFCRQKKPSQNTDNLLSLIATKGVTMSNFPSSSKSPEPSAIAFHLGTKNKNISYLNLASNLCSSHQFHKIHLDLQ